MALGRLPCLETLLLHVDSAEYPWDALTYESCAADFFPALRQLILHRISFDWCTAFLRVLSSASLRGLSVCSEYDDLPSPILLEELCAAISELPSARAITDLFITVGAGQFEAEHCYGVGETYWPQDIAPLFTLCALQRLVIRGQCIAIDVDDPALDTISQNCPDLAELVLAWDQDVYPRPDGERSHEDDDYPYAKPAGLLHLARRCPRMTKLTLAVNGRYLPESRTATRAAASSPAPPLPLLGPAVPPFNAIGSVLGDLNAYMASVLSLLFPQLSEVSNHFAAREGWDISQLHSQLVGVRSQERARAGREEKRPRAPDLSAELGHLFGHVDLP